MIDWAIIREKIEKEKKRRREEEEEERREKVPPSLTSRSLVIREFCAYTHMRMYAYH
jgi:hypothetical protein